MADFEDDDLLDAELMHAFASFDDENIENDSFPSNSKENCGLQTAQNLQHQPKSSLEKHVQHLDKVPAESSKDNLGRQLEEKRTRVLANIRKQEAVSSSGYHEGFTGPKYVDPFSGFTIGSPVLDKDDLKAKMEGKMNVKLSCLKDKIRNHSLGDVNFVVFGVVSKRYQPKTGKGDSSWCTFLISDLQYCSLRLTVFHKDHTKLYREGEGVVVGVLNPSLKLEEEPILSVNDARCILLLGRCLEFGFCQALTQKTGQRCQMPINKKTGDYCEFHITKAYKQSTSRRSHLQVGAPVEPKKEREKRARMIESNQNKFVIYNGKQRLYDSNSNFDQRNFSKAKRPISVTLNQNANAGARDLDVVSTGSVSGTGSGPLEEDSGSNPTFEDLLKRPTLGALNLKRIQGGSDASVTQSRDVKRPVRDRVTARDLLDQHNSLSAKKAVKSNVKEDIVIDLKDTQILQKNTSSLECSAAESPSRNISRVTNAVTLSELKKMKAAAKLASSNAFSSRKKDQIMQRVNSNRDSMQGENGVDSVAPKAKKPRLEHHVGPSSKGKLIENVLSLKSKFSTELDEIEKEHEEKYFKSREKKEQIEERLANTTELKVRAVTCKQCGYIAPSLSVKCKADNHSHSWAEHLKRFFKCGDCCAKTISYQRYPSQPCRNCSGRNFNRTSLIEQNTKLPIYNVEYFKIADAEDFNSHAKH